MKILFYRYGSICEPDVIEQFKNLGLEVDTIENEITDKKLTPAKRVELISQRLSKEQYLFVFSINFFPVISKLCNIYNIKYVTWVVDSPVLELFSKEIQNPCNRVFLFDMKQYEDLHQYNEEGLYHLPLGTNVNRWDKVIAGISAADRVKFSSDISFVGSLYNEKDPYLSVKDPSEYLQGYVNGLFNCQKQIQGYNIIEKSLNDTVISELKEKLPSEFASADATVKNMDTYCAAHGILDMHISSLERIENLQELSRHFNVNLFTRSDISAFKDFPNVHVKGGVKTLDEMPKVFNLSKINLNMTIHSIEKGASLRVWDVMGCGGFLMSNYQEELQGYLVAGEDYDYYTDLGDLLDKCDFYLSHEDIRAKIAKTGYEKVKNFHTYANRMPDMIRTLL